MVFNFVQRPESGAPALISWMGTPILNDVNLQNPVTGEYLQLIDAVCDVSQEKNVVLTPVPGLDGTVKEYISDGDYHVRIQGTLTTLYNEDQYPAEAAAKLRAICKIPGTIPVVSEFLRAFGIYNLVILSARIPQVRGYGNIQPYELECVAETPLELIESND